MKNIRHLLQNCTAVNKAYSFVHSYAVLQQVFKLDKIFNSASTVIQKCGTTVCNARRAYLLNSLLAVRIVLCDYGN